MVKFEIKDGVAIIPEGTTEIGEFAFDGCSSLTNVTIPESVKRLELALSDGVPRLSVLQFLSR